MKTKAMQTAKEYMFNCSIEKVRSKVKSATDTKEYWEKSVRRLSIFIDKPLSIKTTLGNRLTIWKELKRLMEGYEDVPEDNKPFKDIQFNAMKKIISGGAFRTIE
jgi:hypothetical protein